MIKSVRKYYYLFICLHLLLLVSCGQIMIQSTPNKTAVISHDLLTQQAETAFWTALHHGAYQSIPTVERLLLAAYLKNPHDPSLAAHLGFINIWRITERARSSNVPPTIVNSIILSKNYFHDATVLVPTDARYLGFFGDAQLVTGQIFDDQREQVRGYVTLLEAIHAWPEFNYFTAGYPMSTLPASSKYFKEALKWQWATVDRCAGQKVDRQSPTFGPYLSRETKKGPLRACWNSWIAPFNFEGFFLNMGDLLIKSGDVTTAIKIYNNAKLSPSFSVWPYKTMLEKRILNAKSNVDNFQKDYISPDKTIVFNSGRGCVVCHQRL